MLDCHLYHGDHQWQTSKINFSFPRFLLSLPEILWSRLSYRFFMVKSFMLNLRRVSILPATALAIAMSAASVGAQNMYNPIQLPSNNEITDTLSEQDIPTGQGGFARDYIVSLQTGDQIVIDLLSDSFDTIVTLIGPNGMTMAENDDGPDGTTNSLLFARITEGGNYIVRVRAFGEGGTGSFNLKVTRLRPI
ncbi:PPC domain-containing protein [Oscillatoria acuminata]|uniref:Putative pre-peptidase n=1 Tax=Oscillatoria acuminata PCC 6304 TaxID=56110 RepID=K9TCM9_9CYAN|nr:putative pre-peptidase [Oscillatoria acuminata PCC 6304]